MSTFLILLGLSVSLLGVGILGMAIKIIFQTKGEFPQSMIGHNKAMRKKKIYCIKTEQQIVDNKTKKIDGIKFYSKGCGSCN